MSKFKKLKDLFFGEGGNDNSKTPKGKSPGGKGAKGSRAGKGKPKTPKGSKGSGVPSFNIEAWKNGTQRLVCRLNGKFCPIPEAMKQWKAQRASNPKPKNPRVNWNPLDLFRQNNKVAKKGMKAAGSDDPTQVLPGASAGATPGASTEKNKTTVRGNAPRGKIVKQGAKGAQTQHKKGMDLARKAAPDLKRKEKDPFTGTIGGEKTRIQQNTGIGNATNSSTTNAGVTTTPQNTTPPTRPQTKTPPPSSPPTTPQTKPKTKPVPQDKIPTRLETGIPTTPQSKPQTQPIPQNDIPTRGENMAQIFSNKKKSTRELDLEFLFGRGKKTTSDFDLEFLIGRDADNASSSVPDTRFFGSPGSKNPLRAKQEMGTRIEKPPQATPKNPTLPPRSPQNPPTTDPNIVAARGEAWRLRKDLGQNIPTTGNKAIAKYEAQKLRQKFQEIKAVIGKGKKSQAPTPLDTTLRPSTDPGISVEITKKTGVGTRLKQNIKSIGEGMESLGKSAKAAAARGVIAANAAVYEAVQQSKSLARNAGDQSRRFIQGVGESVKKAGQRASETMRNVTPPNADVVKNIQNKGNVVKTVQETMPAKGAGEAIKQVAQKGSKSVREAVGEGINKGIEILTDPAVQIGLEVARTPHTLQKLKNQKAGPFETALTVGGRIVGAGAESVLIPKWVPNWVRLFTFGEDIGGAVAGTAGKVIDKSGAGKVIIDTTTQTAKTLDQKFPGAPQIDINKQRTRPKFKEMTGEL